MSSHPRVPESGRPGSSANPLPFAPLPHELVADRRVKAGDRDLVAFLLSIARTSPYVQVSNREIMDGLGIGKRTVQDRIERCRKAGWLRCEEDQGHRTGRRIVFTWREAGDRIPHAGAGVHDAPSMRPAASSHADHRTPSCGTPHATGRKSAPPSSRGKKPREEESNNTRSGDVVVLFVDEWGDEHLGHPGDVPPREEKDQEFWDWFDSDSCWFIGHPCDHPYWATPEDEWSPFDPLDYPEPQNESADWEYEQQMAEWALEDEEEEIRAKKPTGIISIEQGDCIEAMKVMDDESIDVIITSPPYNKGVKYRTYKDNLPYDAYLEWTERWVEQAVRLLKADGTFWLNIGSFAKNPTLDMDVCKIIEKRMITQERIVWQKSAIIDGVRRGNYRPSPGDHYLDSHHEYVYMFSKSGRVKINRYVEGVSHPLTNPDNTRRWKHGRTHTCGGDIWFLPYTPRSGPASHPAQFPASLPVKCLRLHGTRPDLKVLDPFGGSGTTGVACKKLGASCHMIELSQGYVDEARKRLGIDFQANTGNGYMNGRKLR